MRTPMHGKATKSEIFDLWVWAQSLNPKGFRKPATSRKNRKGKVTRVEALGREVYGK